MKILKKGIASENLSDSSNEHFVVVGEPYFIGKWIYFSNEGKKYVQYMESKHTEDALIHVGEVFSTDMNFNDKLQLDIYNYHMLCCSL